MSKRVLIVKLSSMGDVLHVLSAISDACQRMPGIKFDWLIDEAFADIASWHLAVDRVICSHDERVADDAACMQAIKPESVWQCLQTLLARLSEESNSTEGGAYARGYL